MSYFAVVKYDYKIGIIRYEQLERDLQQSSNKTVSTLVREIFVS